MITKGSWTVSLGVRTWISETICALVIRGGSNTHVEAFLSESSDPISGFVARIRLTFAEDRDVMITLTYFWFKISLVFKRFYCFTSCPSCRSVTFVVIHKHRNIWYVRYWYWLFQNRITKAKRRNFVWICEFGYFDKWITEVTILNLKLSQKTLEHPLPLFVSQRIFTFSTALHATPYTVMLPVSYSSCLSTLITTQNADASMKTLRLSNNFKRHWNSRLRVFSSWNQAISFPWSRNYANLGQNDHRGHNTILWKTQILYILITWVGSKIVHFWIYDRTVMRGPSLHTEVHLSDTVLKGKLKNFRFYPTELLQNTPKYFPSVLHETCSCSPMRCDIPYITVHKARTEMDLALEYTPDFHFGCPVHQKIDVLFKSSESQGMYPNIWPVGVTHSMHRRTVQAKMLYRRRDRGDAMTNQ